MSNNDKRVVDWAGGSPEVTFSVGHGNYVIRSRVVAILEPGSLPMKRLRDRAQQKEVLVDATAGRKMRSLIVLDSGHIVVSALAPQTLQERLSHSPTMVRPALMELEEGEFVS